MTPESIERIRGAITAAETLEKEGNLPAAAQSFGLARSLTVQLAPKGAIQGVIARSTAGFARERERYRDIIAKRGGEAPLLIIGDSLGLPRPDAMQDASKGASVTYAWKLAGEGGRRVTSLCQRFMTTAKALELLQEDPSLGAGGDFILHLGLNDCANRMFLEEERLALDLLPADLKDAIVKFSQRRRAVILNHLPSRHYVNLPDFRANIDAIALLLKARGVRRIVLATIILPPERAWASTPGINANFAGYNLEIMLAARRHGAALLDIDRMIWQTQHQNTLLSDGMHLTPAGHDLFAQKVAALL